MYQPSDTSPLNDVPLGFGISALPPTIHMVRNIFCGNHIDKTQSSLASACQEPSKGTMGVLSGLKCIFTIVL